MTEQAIINEVIANLKIDNPCPMLLARLKGETDSSYYCNSCKKEIIDFRNCSNEEILQRIIPGKTCGIFYEGQLKGQHQVHYNFFQKAAFYFLVICSSIGFNVTPMNAQSKQKITTDKFPKSVYQSHDHSTKTITKDLPVTTPKELPKEEIKTEVEPKTRKRRFRKFGKRSVMGCPAF